MKIKISSDSTCDLSKELIERYDISIAPLCVNKGTETFRDGVDITPPDIYAHVDAGGALCTTAAVNISEYTEIFTEYLKNYDAVIHITISSDFSICYQNACAAAAEMENVYVVDSRNLSTGHGHLVLEAAKLAAQGENAQEIAEKMRALAEKVDASFILSRLDYMVKGGRCSGAAALGANLLGLKPCIEVKNGKMGVCKKYRGSFEKCLDAYIKERLTAEYLPERIFITHSGVSDEALEVARAAVKKYGNFETVEETVAGCTVSCHCGPGTLGVLFIRK